MATWRELIQSVMDSNKDSFDNVTGMAASSRYSESVDLESDESWLDIEFDDGFGSPKGHCFTLWTKNHVYFPVVYDGAESVGSAPRDPCPVATEHVGSF